MDILAYVCRGFAFATRQVVGRGARIVTSPKATARNLTAWPEVFERHDVLYLDMHGMAGSVYMYNNQNVPTLSVKQVERMDLRGTVVVATTCYLPETPFLQAFLDAGAVVVAGHGENYGSRSGNVIPAGSQLVAKHVITALRRGEKPTAALACAQERMAHWRWLPLVRKSIDDSIAFEVYE